VQPVSRVLVVDDDAAINRLLCVRLERAGYTTRSAEDGSSALAALEAEPADLLFLDVAMPDMDGMEVLERIRARALDVAVIMTTAYGSEQVAIDALRRGADDYLRKPFEPAEFQAVLQRTAQRLQLSRENAALRAEVDNKRRLLEAELARAMVVQAELLPGDVPELPGWTLAARCIPARQVGGDFYDWQQPAPGVLNLTLGDVMGKGMPAALLMATVRAVLRAVVRRSRPAVAMQRVAAGLYDDLARSSSFVTLYLSQLDLQSGRLSYVDAGHGYGRVLRASGEVVRLAGRGLPIGVLPDERYQEGSVTVERGDALVLCSDGFAEMLDPRFTLDEHLARHVPGRAGAEEILNGLLSLVDRAGQPDDITVLVARHAP
jgi:serine phosphatase RsbU (regulator of sigma subunit)